MPSRHCRGKKHTRAALNIVASYHSNGMVIRLSSLRQWWEWTGHAAMLFIYAFAIQLFHSANKKNNNNNKKKSHATPPLPLLFSNGRVKWEVNSWMWGDNSRAALQIMMRFWLSVCDCVCKSVSVLAYFGRGGIFAWRFSDASLMSLSRSPPPHCSLAVTKWEENSLTQTHTCIHTQVHHLSNKIIFIHYNWLHSSNIHWMLILHSQHTKVKDSCTLRMLTIH